MAIIKISSEGLRTWTKRLLRIVAAALDHRALCEEKAVQSQAASLIKNNLGRSSHQGWRLSFADLDHYTAACNASNLLSHGSEEYGAEREADTRLRDDVSIWRIQLRICFWSTFVDGTEDVDGVLNDQTNKLPPVDLRAMLLAHHFC